MLATKILFLILIAVCIAFRILYLWDFAMVLLVIIAALPVVMLVLLLITKKLTKTEFIIPDKTAAKNVPFQVHLCITNRSILPIGKAEAFIEYSNTMGSSVSCFELHMPVHPRNTQKMAFRISSEFCGKLSIKCSAIHIYDPLKLFRVKIGKNTSAEITVMPDIHEISGNICFTDIIDDDNCLYSQHKPGDDPSEIFDLREYAPGDKLNRIHWKLSSKKNDFIVKDYSLPIDAAAVLFLDMKIYDEKNNSASLFSTLLEAFFSISAFLIGNERVHTIVYFNQTTGNFKKLVISDSESFNAAVNELMLSVSVSTNFASPHYYLDNELTSSVSSFTCVTSAQNPQLYHSIGECVNSEIKNFVVVIGEEKISSNILTDTLSGINVIPVVAGNVSAYIKDIEL